MIFSYYMKFIQVVANATMKNLDRFQEYVDDVTLKDVDLFNIADEVRMYVHTSYTIH